MGSVIAWLLIAAVIGFIVLAAWLGSRCKENDGKPPTSHGY